MTDSYHNTTNESGDTLAGYEETAATQDERIHQFFRRKPGVPMTPSQVHSALATAAPLTSIRRAMSNLTNAGVLVKTDVKAQGPYGRPEYCWMLAPMQRRLL